MAHDTVLNRGPSPAINGLILACLSIAVRWLCYEINITGRYTITEVYLSVVIVEATS